MQSSGRSAWKLQRQRLSVEIDYAAKRLSGYSEVTVQPTGSYCDQVQVHSRQVLITRVECNDLPTTFQLFNYLEQVVPEEQQQQRREETCCRDLEAFNVFHKAALRASDSGELLLDVPSTLQKHDEERVKVKLERAEGEATQQQEAEAQRTLGSLTFRIHFVLEQPRGGLHFVMPDEAHPHRPPHAYTYSPIDGARVWFPCVDTLTDRCPFELEYTVPADHLVISSGDLTDQVLSDDGQRKTFYYSLSSPTPAYCIGFSAGKFEVLCDEEQPNLTHFCLPSRKPLLRHTIGFLHQAWSFYEEFLGCDFPYGSYKQVFVEDLPSNVVSFASLSVLSTHLLHDETIIDQTFISRRHLSRGLSYQWFGNFIGPKTWPDAWVIHGAAGHLANLFLRQMFGKNELRFEQLKEAEAVLARGQTTLYNMDYSHPIELYSKAVVQKAPLVMFMIEKQLGEAFRKILSQLVGGGRRPNEEASAAPPPRPVCNLSTHSFMKLAKKITGHDLKYFQKKWIFRGGYPDLTCGFWFNKKRHQTEFVVKHNPGHCLYPKFSGLTVRVHELDGTCDHVVPFEEEIYGVDFPCHSRARKGRRKKQQSQENLNPEEPEPILEYPKRNDTPLLWIRIDPEMDLPIKRILFKQPEIMWENQLELDKDVAAQYEALHALQSIPSPNTLHVLATVVENPRVFYRIRMEAAYGLARAATRESNWAGLDQALQIFKNYFYDEDMVQVRPNDFSDFALYYVQKALAEAVALVNDKEAHRATPSEALDFLLELLKTNDNQINKYSDCFYVASLLRAVAKTNTQGMGDTEKIMKQLHRYLKYDQLVPSYANVVSVACLRSMYKMQAKRGTPLDLSIFKEYSRYGYYRKVRLAAFKGLLKLALFEEGVVDSVLDAVHNDPDIGLRIRLLGIMYKAIAATNAAPTTASSYFDSMLSVSSREKPKAFSSSTSVRLMHRLWSLMNSQATAFNSQYRREVWNVYNQLFGPSAQASPSPLANLLLPVSDDRLIKQVKASAPLIDLNTIKKAKEARTHRRENKRKAQEAGLEQTPKTNQEEEHRANGGEEGAEPLVASVVDGSKLKIKIARRPSATFTPTSTPVSTTNWSPVSSEGEEEEAKPPTTTPVPRLRIKLSGKTIK